MTSECFAHFSPLLASFHFHFDRARSNRAPTIIPCPFFFCVLSTKLMLAIYFPRCFLPITPTLVNTPRPPTIVLAGRRVSLDLFSTRSLGPLLDKSFRTKAFERRSFVAPQQDWPEFSAAIPFPPCLQRGFPRELGCATIVSHTPEFRSNSFFPFLSCTRPVSTE